MPRLSPGHISLDQNSKIVIALACLTLLVVVSHRLGVLDKRFDALDSSNHQYIAQATDDASSAVVSIEEGLPALRCHIAPGDGVRFCSLTIELVKDLTRGVDFSGYDSISLKLAYKAPREKEPIRIFLRNFNPAYATIEDSVSPKFNMVKFVPENYGGEIDIPMSAFQVATWWMGAYKVDFDQALVDVSNTIRIELVSPSDSMHGTYYIKVTELVFHGKLVSEQVIDRSIFIIWVLVVVFLLNQQRQQSDRISNEDSLTHILNRRGVNRWLNDVYARKQQAQLSMFYIDIDGFKKINDEHGHAAGDLLLVDTCRRIQEALDSYLKMLGEPVKHVFARLSGDEFTVLLLNLADSRREELALALLQAFNQPFIFDKQEIDVNVSIGIAGCVSDETSAAELIRHADAAMYCAKHSGKNQHQFYDQRLAAKVETERNIFDGLKEALDSNLFSLVFMPIYDVPTGRVRGVEVLIRSESPLLSGFGPDQYIPVAEQTGLIEVIDCWVIENTFKLLEPCVSQSLRQGLVFAINISANELRNLDFVQRVAGLLDRYHIPGELIELEITETSLINADGQSISILNGLKKLGVRLSLDDYGTGYTAFNQLLEYPIDSIKIDRSFVSGPACLHVFNKTMVDVILSIAGSYGFHVVAEGVESDEQYRYLQVHGCQFAQGYYFSRPVPWLDFKKLASLD